MYGQKSWHSVVILQIFNLLSVCCQSLCQSVCLFVCLSLSACLFVCLSVPCIYFFLEANLSVGVCLPADLSSSYFVCLQLYTVKKVSHFPVPRRDVTYQTLPGRE